VKASDLPNATTPTLSTPIAESAGRQHEPKVGGPMWVNTLDLSHRTDGTAAKAMAFWPGGGGRAPSGLLLMARTGDNGQWKGGCKSFPFFSRLLQHANAAMGS
jgi:hypothetical protein